MIDLDLIYHLSAGSNILESCNDYNLAMNLAKKSCSSKSNHKL